MPRRQRPTKSRPGRQDQPPADARSDLRIIGGSLRGRKLAYHGDASVTRPMKHRVREAIFNLVGMGAKGKHALDVFAGTGALGLEALSRGAARATFIEKHLPTAAVVEQNIASLAVEGQAELIRTSAFLWGRRDLPVWEAAAPWLVFVSPPYDFFVERQEDMLRLIENLIRHAPTGSLLVVEADERFDFGLLPGGVRRDRHDTAAWDVRPYPPAVVGVLQTGEAN